MSGRWRRIARTSRRTRADHLDVVPVGGHRVADDSARVDRQGAGRDGGVPDDVGQLALGAAGAQRRDHVQHARRARAGPRPGRALGQDDGHQTALAIGRLQEYATSR
jgi:hypothetical protein